MRDSQYRAFFEFGGDDLMDQAVISDVDVGSGLIDEDYTAVLEQGSADA